MLRGLKSVGLGVSVLLLLAGAAQADPVSLVSRVDPSLISDTATGQSNTIFPATSAPSISSDGRYVAFTSNAPNLISGLVDANRANDVFLHDRVAGTVTLVSHEATSLTTTSNSTSMDAVISSDGQYVAFVSWGTNLVASQLDTNNARDVFLWTRATGAITLVSRSTTSATATGNGESTFPVISGNGSTVAFNSTATNLVSGITDTNAASDVFFWDRTTGNRFCVSRSSSVTSTGNGASSVPSISNDGQWIAFQTLATNLLFGLTDSNAGSDVFLYNRSTGARILVSGQGTATNIAGNSPSNTPIVSADGNWIAFRSLATNIVSSVDFNGVADIYLYQRSTGARTLASRAPVGQAVGVSSSAGFNISADGAYIAYTSAATNVVAGQTDTNGKDDIFLFTRSGGSTVLVSRAGSATTAGNDSSFTARLSGDGRYVAFTSYATNLVTNQSDANAESDVFVFDRTAGTLQLVSHTPGSSTTTGNGRSSSPGISSDGAFLAFNGPASDLVANVIDSNGKDDVFLHDRAAGTNTVVSLSAFDSVTPAGFSYHSTFPLASVSDDGRWIVFTSDGVGFNADPDLNGKDDIFLRDRISGTTVSVSGGANDWSRSPVVSADGRYVAYVSAATNLVPGQVDPVDNPNNFLGDMDVFLFDRETGTNTLVSHAAAAALQAANGVSNAPVVSADGRYVAFVSGATNLVAGQTDINLDTDVFLWDRDTGVITLVSRTAASATTAGNDDARGPVMSADGRWIAYLSNATNVTAGQSDSSATDDLFLFDRDTATNRLVSRANGSTTQASGRSQDPAITPDGRFLVFACTGSNLVASMSDSNSETDVFLYDRSNGSMKLVSARAGVPTSTPSRGSFAPRVSADGNWVVFVSNAFSLLVASQDDTNAASDVFLRNVAASTTALVSHQAGNAARTANGESLSPSISADGRWIAFASAGTTLLSPQTDTTGTRDVFLYDRDSASSKMVSRVEASESTAGNAASDRPVISAGGSAIVFDSDATNLVADDYNSSRDVFVYESTRFVDLAVTNSNGVDTAVAGTAVAYTITVTNKGPFDVAGVLVKDTFPSPMQDVAWTCTATGGAGGAVCPTNGTGNLNASVDLPVDGVVTFTVTANLYKGSFGTLINTAEAVLPAGFADSQPADNVATDTDPLVLRTDLSVALADSPDPAVRGGALTYLVSVHNAGPSLATTDVTVSLTLPSGAAFASAAGDGWTCGHAAGVVTCTTPNPDLGDVPSIIVQTVAPVASATPLTASVTVSSGATDPDPADNTAIAETAFPQTGIQVTAEDGLATTEAGGTATFTVALTSAPLAVVSVSVASGDATEGTAEPASLTFTPETWSEPRTVTVTGADDKVDDGEVSYTIELAAAESTDAGYAGVDPEDVELTNEDDDQAGIHVTPTSGLETTEAGGTATFSVVLESEPTADVTIEVTSDDETEGTVSTAALTFTAADWNVPQEVTVTGADDDLTDGSVAYTVVLEAESGDGIYDALDPDDVSAVNQDDASEGTFYTVPPCRLLDTRRPEDGPALVSGVPVVLHIHGACGIPETAKAIAVIVTALEPRVPGRLILYPSDVEVPSASILPFRAHFSRSNNALLSLSADGNLTVLPLLVAPQKVGVHVAIDVSGYFE